ncbi:hypothetical protein B296_00057329 [Ensete ventricosum]|uniref:Uncharacterized protein n=1 Tax=Ensete ventricosum TaxID=4639 RepID=A0A426WY21_ENSVE|nr:hypothetical protein B296_00057329 [Ensete ventricosum]
MRSRMSTVLQKNATVINQSAQSLVSISFSYTLSEFQNTSHSQHNSPWKVVQAWFREKM